ncbi:MAG: Crp/Fnr family transcriptional regulator [Sulfurimonas sp.]|nr:Crp/Fnr family transcriptional regulator [Sulfurimonas sp.]
MKKNKELNFISLFAGLSKDEIEKIVNISTIKKINKYSILFYQGDDSNYLHIVLRGKIEVYKVNAKGKNIPLNLFKPYESIAELSNYKGIAFPATAHALEDSEILSIDFKKFKEEFFSHPVIVSNILESMSNKIINLEKFISSNITMNATKRVIYHLLENKIDLNAQKHSEIADQLNISPVTLSRILKKLKENKAISLENNIYKITQKLLKMNSINQC